MSTVTEQITYGNDTPIEFREEIASLQKSPIVRGIKYPFTTTEGYGSFNKATGRHLLKSMVYQFINTQTGERPMLPNYGVNLQQFLFEPLDELLHEEIVEEVHTSIAINHPEWEILKLSVFESEDRASYKGIPGLIITLFVRLIGDDESAVEVQAIL